MIEDLIYATQFILGAGFGKIAVACFTVLVMWHTMILYFERCERRKKQNES